MIVEMKHLTLLCVAREGMKTLETLRDIGCVHMDLSAADSPDFGVLTASRRTVDGSIASSVFERRSAREVFPK